MLCLSAVVAFGFIPASFRFQSTAGTWQDDYDLMFDPCRILEIDGFRLYTNLANYATGNEEQFGANRSNLFLVGGSAHQGWGVAPAGIFDHYQFEQPLFTGLFSPDSLDSLFGQGRSTWTEWRDLDSNGSYDFKRVVVTERNAWRKGSADDFYLGAGIRLGEGTVRLGAGLVWNNGIIEATNPDSDFIRHNYDSSLVAGRFTYQSDDTGHYTQLSGEDRKRLVLSGWFNLGESWELAALLAPGLITRDDRDSRTEKSFTNFNPGSGAPTDFAQLGIEEWTKSPYSGFDVPGQLQLVSRNEKTETWWSLSGFFQEQKLGADGGRHYVASYHRTLNPGDSSYQDTTVHNWRGAIANWGMGLGLLRRHYVSAKLDLGWGVNLGLRWGVDSLADEESERERVVYDNGDSLANRLDYTRTTTRAESWLRRTTGTHAFATVPVGLEFRPIGPVALRLGALPTFIWNDVVTTEQLLALAPAKSRTDYGDGTFTETVEEVARHPDSREQTRGFNQTTQLTYGAGFKPIDNLQIDLMGFANLTNLTGWRVSATLRF